MRTINFGAGCHINRAAEMLISAAPARGLFNEIEMTASPGETVDLVAGRYHAESEARAKAWHESPAGIADAERNRAEIAHLQAKHDSLIAAMPALDINDRVAVLDWLCGVQEASDRIGVKVSREQIILAFGGYGYFAGDCCGDAFVAGDADVEFRWLVGQALDGLSSTGAIHGLFHKFARQWKAKHSTQESAI